MIVRYADRPMENKKDRLPEYDGGSWFFQAKEDGWFTFVCVGIPTGFDRSYTRGKNLLFLSRRGKKKGGPTTIPVSDEIVSEIEKLNLPENTMFCAEWMARRTIGECPERLYFHDLLWLEDKWMGKTQAWDRLQKVIELIKPGDRSFGSLESKTKHSNTDIPDWTDTDPVGFFEKITKVPHTEGIVAKHKKGLMTGDTMDGVDNPMIIKIKWRSGETGRETFNM